MFGFDKVLVNYLVPFSLSASSVVKESYIGLLDVSFLRTAKNKTVTKKHPPKIPIVNLNEETTMPETQIGATIAPILNEVFITANAVDLTDVEYTSVV